jgi:hypothetical protein
MARLADRNVFPNLIDVVLAGHPAGGQFVQRYAAANPERFPTRYIVANPSSYLYMDKQRWTGGSLDQFTVPTILEQSRCPTYNRYRYGLEGLNIYMQVVGESKIRSQYAERRVIYMLGEDDNDPLMTNSIQPVPRCSRDGIVWSAARFFTTIFSITTGLRFKVGTRK